MTGRGRGLLAAGLCVLAFVLAGAALGQAAWHTMTGSERSFTADLPAAPKYTAMQMRTGVGASYVMHQYLFDQSPVAFVVQTAIYPPDVNVSNPQANLQGGLDNAARNMDGAKWASIDWVKHQGLTAVDAVGMRDGQDLRSYSVMKGRQSVTMIYAGPAGTARSADVNRFVGSLRLPP